MPGLGPCLNNIVRDIVNASDPLLVKLDVTHAFRNLRVDPAYCVKFGIKLEGSYFNDGAVVFCLHHGTVAFQFCSDSIASMMNKVGVNLNCYTNDYVVIAPRYEAVFSPLCNLLTELDLPITQDKLTYPTKYLTVLGIKIDIQANTMRIEPKEL